MIYKSASKLYEEMQIAIGDGSLPKYRTALSKVHLLILNALSAEKHFRAPLYQNSPLKTSGLARLRLPVPSNTYTVLRV